MIVNVLSLTRYFDGEYSHWTVQFATRRRGIYNFVLINDSSQYLMTYCTSNEINYFIIISILKFKTVKQIDLHGDRQIGPGHRTKRVLIILAKFLHRI